MSEEQRTDLDTGQPVPTVMHAKKPKIKLILTVLLILALAGGAGGYWWRDKTAKESQKRQDTEIAQLKDKTSSLDKDLADAKAKSNTATATTTPVAVPSAATVQSVKDSITSGNTAALEGYMAAKVTVTIAASESAGVRTPAQAVSDVTSYIKSATSPWNFALPVETLTAFGSGSYGVYFPNGAVVGKAANKYVISFVFNSAGKINTVFMAASSDIL